MKELFKKLVIVMVVFSLTLSCFTMSGFASSSVDYWDGTTVAPTKGSGTIADPYLVETPEEFAYMMLEANGGEGYENGAVYKLMNDIYLNDISKINWQTGVVKQGYTPNNWTPEIFSGIIDGNGHMVYGLYIEKNPAAYVEKWGEGTGSALISENWVNKWIKIENLGMDCVYVNGPSVSSAFIAGANSANGYSTTNEINGCYLGSNVTLKGFAVGGFYGGGYGNKVTLKIKNCASLVTNMKDNNRGKTAGFVGDFWGSEDDYVRNSYALTCIQGNNQLGGGYTNSYAISHPAAGSGATLLTIGKMQGLDVLTNPAKMPLLGDGFVATETFPVPVAFEGKLGGSASMESGKVWNGTYQFPTAAAGTEDDPFLISTAEQLAWVVSNGGKGYYKLTADIYLNDPTKINWETGVAEEGYTPNVWFSSNNSKPFDGTLDGDGHTIYGLYYKNSSSERVDGNYIVGYGLLPAGYEVHIKGLGIDKSYMEAYTNYSFGAFIGQGQNTGLRGTMTECYVGADVTVKGFDAGLFIGGGDIDNKGFVFTDCYAQGKAIVSHRGGLVGDAWTTDYSFERVYSVNVALMGNGTPKKNVNTFVKLSESQTKGNLFDGNAMALGDAFVATDGYPVLKKFVGETGSGWNGLATPFDAGDGASAATAYEISSVGQLAYAVALGGNGKYYKLTNNIYINDINKINWETGTLIDTTYTPTPWFYGTDSSSAYYKAFGIEKQWSGTLDGCGYTVFGLWYSPDFTDNTSGLIPSASNTTIKNLHLSSSYVVGGRFSGAISSTFSGTLNNVSADDTVIVYGKKNARNKDGNLVESFSIGGLVGYSNGTTLDGCAFFGLLKNSGIDHIYGLVGTSWGTKIHASNSFSIGYQPFTVSSPSITYSSDADAQAYYNNLYKVTNVYTNTTRKANNGGYVLKVGDEKENKIYQNVFTFTTLATSDMKGYSALNNMPGISDDVWFATSEYPRTYGWAIDNGDANLDGKSVLSGDLRVVRNSIIAEGDSTCTDINRDGVTNVCDLVSMWTRRPLRTAADGKKHYLNHWYGFYKANLIYAANDTDAKNAATAFQTKMAEKGITLSVYADTAIKEGQHEVLFGNTNRGLSETGLLEGQYSITTNGKKIVFSAGSGTGLTTLTTAVKYFFKYYEDGFAPIITGYNEFAGESVSLRTELIGNSSKTYTYVWGDEFYGDDLDETKWVCKVNNSMMSAYSDMVLLDDDETVNVADGRLRMTAKQYSVDGNEAIKYAAPASVHTKGTMEYKYGYVEIKAKIPYKIGVWPSFWMKSDAVLGGRQNYDYFVEIDMLEIFGSTSTLYSNVHKWYSTAGKEKYGLDHIMARDDATGNWLGNLFDKWQNGEDSKTVSSTSDWHTYGMGWDSNYLYMYVDRSLFKRYAISGSGAAKNIFGSDVANKDSTMTGFHDPLYVIFNNHLFTEDGDAWKPDDTNNRISKHLENVPAHYDIDYFRLYQSSDSGTALYTKG